jgi:ribonuclease G
MAKNLLVINVDIREIRVALIENGIVAELHIERHGSKGTLGNIYVGKVSRVLPGMQAAFIDIGQERAAFLHVEDLIRPDDFEAYLAGKHSHASSETSEEPPTLEDADAGDHETEAPALPAAAAAEDALPAIDEVDEDAELVPSLSSAALAAAAAAEAEVDEEAEEAEADEIEAAEAALEAERAGDADSDAAHAEEDDAADDQAEDEDEDSAQTSAEDEDAAELAASADAGSAAETDPEADDEETDEADEAESEDADEADEADGAETANADAPGTTEPGQARRNEDLYEPAPGYTIEGEAAPAAAGAPEGEAGLQANKARTRRGGRGRRRRGRTSDAAARVAAPMAAAPPPERAPKAARQNGRGGNDRGQRPAGGGDRSQRDRGPRGQAAATRKDPLRVSKSTPIREVVREGQEVIVQVSKEPIGTKGARVTSHVSLPGRYVVYLPTVEHVGISKRIGSDKERGRLREAIEAMKPPQGGLIVRTLAEGLTKKSLKADVGYLVRLWGEIARKRETTPRAPECLYTELDLILKTARDLFTDDIEKIVIDSKEEHARLSRFVEMFMPDRVAAIELYEGTEPIFDEYGIEDEIGRALSRKVPLNSGGHLIIDQAEALTAIDVNTGRFVGKGSRDLEETILATNLEAVEEIAYQLRFRNIGGLIILDLIDMDRPSNREKVRRRLEQLLAKDKAKTTLNRISDLGLIEMTRKRTRESLGRLMNEPCFYCDGTGNLQSRETIAYEILRQIKRDRLSLRGYSVVVNAHPAVVELLRTEERSAVQEAERRYQRRIELVPRKEYHLEQFDLVGK